MIEAGSVIYVRQCLKSEDAYGRVGVPTRVTTKIFKEGNSRDWDWKVMLELTIHNDQKSFSKSFGILSSSTSCCLAWKLKNSPNHQIPILGSLTSFSTSISKYIKILGGLVQRWPHPESQKTDFYHLTTAFHLRLVRLYSPTRWGAPQRDVQGAPCEEMGCFNGDGDNRKWLRNGKYMGKQGKCHIGFLSIFKMVWERWWNMMSL